MDRPRSSLGAPESEQAVLGALIIDPASRGETLEQLRPEAFEKAGHRKIFSAISALYVEGRDFDAVQVVSALRANGELDQVGGPEYIAQLVSDCPIVFDGPRYAQNVVQFCQRRRIVKALDDLRGEVAGSSEFDPGRFLNRVVSALSDARQGKLVSQMSDLVAEAIEARMNSEQAQQDRPHVGIPKLDGNLNLFTPCEVTILAGRPGCGKSTLMRQIVASAARSVPALLFSLEVSARTLTQQILCEAAGVPYYDWRMGRATSDQEALLIQYAGYDWWQNIRICEKTSLSAMDVSIALTQQVAQGVPIGLVAIDYLGLMRHEKAERNDLAIAATTRSLKQLSLERKVPILLLSQLNRDVERRGSASQGDRPRLADLRDSGAIEQDADNVVFLWRRDREAEYAVVEERTLTVAKHRNGAVFELDLLFDKKSGRFRQQPEASHA